MIIVSQHSESEEEPPPKRKAIGLVRPIPEESPKIPDNPEIPQQINPIYVEEEQIRVIQSQS